MSTPWGRSQHYTRFAEGFGGVSTAGHGGFVATKEYAQLHFTPACLRYAEKVGGMLFWEEDCLYALPALESEALWPIIFSYGEQRSPEERRAELIQTISRWTPDYLIARTIEPDRERYEQWKRWRENDRRRAERDADLIVAAIYYGEYVPDEPRRTKVTTADGKQHLVTSASYTEASKDFPLTLLSHCALATEEN